MAAEYQQLRDNLTGDISATVLRVLDQAYIPDDPANRDRQLFSVWLAEGNTPDPPPPVPEPPDPAPLTLGADPEGPMDAVTLRFQDAALAAIRDPAIDAHTVLDARVTALETQARRH
jgi:hypothetical protein